MTKIQYCSDLHLEFPENKEYIEKHPIEKAGDVLILAGDIVPFAEMDQFDWFFDRLSDQFEAVYWLPGNHEYYDSDINERTGSFQEKIRNNVFLLNNQVVEREGCRMIFTTLWSKISEHNFRVFTEQWPDFQQIHSGNEKFNPQDYNELFEENSSFLTKALSEEKANAQTIVVTHHVPTLKKLSENQKDNSLNETFAAELSDLIVRSSADYWIYGHDHKNSEPFKIGDTKMLNNQLGYVRYDEHKHFRKAQIIESNK